MHSCWPSFRIHFNSIDFFCAVLFCCRILFSFFRLHFYFFSAIMQLWKRNCAAVVCRQTRSDYKSEDFTFLNTARMKEPKWKSEYVIHVHRIRLWIESRFNGRSTRFHDYYSDTRKKTLPKWRTNGIYQLFEFTSLEITYLCYIFFPFLTLIRSFHCKICSKTHLIRNLPYIRLVYCTL